MDRRKFLSVLGIGGTAALALPSLPKVWLPPAPKVTTPNPTIFVPPTTGWLPQAVPPLGAPVEEVADWLLRSYMGTWNGFST